MEVKVDLGRKDLSLLFKPYERIMVEYAWEEGAKPVGSGKLFLMVNERLPEGQTISRTSVIFAANRFKEKYGIWDCTEGTEKGGYRRLYFAKVTQSEAWKILARKFASKVIEASGLSCEELFLEEK